MLNREIPFRARLEGDFRVRFYNAVSSINENTSLFKIEEIANDEIEWVQDECTYNLEQRKNIALYGCFFVILQEHLGRHAIGMACCI